MDECDSHSISVGRNCGRLSSCSAIGFTWSYETRSDQTLSARRIIKVGVEKSPYRMQLAKSFPCPIFYYPVGPRRLEYDTSFTCKVFTVTGRKRIPRRPRSRNLFFCYRLADCSEIRWTGLPLPAGLLILQPICFVRFPCRIRERLIIKWRNREQAIRRRLSLANSLLCLSGFWFHGGNDVSVDLGWSDEKE